MGRKLDDALWAFRIAFKNPLGTTLYRMIYGKARPLLLELEYKALWALKTCNLDPSVTARHRKMQMNELAELRDKVYKTSYIYKELTKLTHDAKLIPTMFTPGDKVLLFNSRFKKFAGKFRSRWSRPYKVIHAFPHGVVELEGPTGNFKVNRHQLKAYLEDHDREEHIFSFDPF
ncbi:uncharacterized protein [Rutidosis leptorrhynchoides]|uniref:uncharacterized protein n=1 Tax=Rutidosis leptorrhynchoides TaxID=125765 RepID=UPI003A9995A7